LNDIFHIQSFWGGHGEILPKAGFIQESEDCPESSESATGRVSDYRNMQIADRLLLFYGP
jgi:hypothetical protein